MKKIMFDDKHQLTDAVIEKRKCRTTREEIKDAVDIMEQFDSGFVYRDDDGKDIFHKFKYKVGEVVAVAQRYKNMYTPPAIDENGNSYIIGNATAGWNNKMFVKASNCIHQIQITDIKVQRLQDISDEDCMLEGIIKGRVCNNSTNHWMDTYYRYESSLEPFASPQIAFSILINRICGRGTWERNNYHVVYYFRLIK